MRRVLVAAAAAFTLLTAAASQDVVLKSGETIRATKVVEKGRQLIVTTTDGRLLSVSASDVDREKTAAARAAAAAPKPAVGDAIPKKRSIADVAAGRKDRKAMVVLTDGDVAQVLEQGEGDAPQGSLDVSGANATKTSQGYTVTGTVVNSGQAEVGGPGVRVEGLGPNGNVVVSASASADKPKLEAGHTASFKIDVATSENVTSFRYVPQWQAVLAVRRLGEGGEPAPGEGAAPATPALAAAPAAPAAERPRPTAIPRPDMPAPPAQYPVGAPTTPGGLYVPATSKDGQPKQPGSN